MPFMSPGEFDSAESKPKGPACHHSAEEVQHAAFHLMAAQIGLAMHQAQFYAAARYLAAALTLATVLAVGYGINVLVGA